MSQYLNTSKACTELMGVSQEVTILERTVRRLAAELGIPLRNTAGVSYEQALEGNSGIDLNYHRDFDGYECFAAKKENSGFAIMSARGEYSICLKNRGRNLKKSALAEPANGIEKKLNLRILIPDDIRSEPEKIHEPLVDIEEAELDAITSRTVLKYLS
ncbi:MAG: hypothetical protein NTW67_04475 [Candidatus Woesearchaeota archaeon]|nr:hypothetical protein [Candidatus Woesearchaeota archaeon]